MVTNEKRSGRYLPLLLYVSYDNALHLVSEITNPVPTDWGGRGCRLHDRDSRNRLYYHFRFLYLVWTAL